jgi:hypothetical protein
MRINCWVLIAIISVLSALLSGALVHQVDVRMISKRADTVKVFIRDTITLYVGSSAQFYARRCDDIQWRSDIRGMMSQGFQSSIQTSQAMRSWGLGLFLWYDIHARSFSPILSYRYQHYYFWIKPVQPYGLGFGLQF